MTGHIYALRHRATGYYWVGATTSWVRWKAGLPSRFERGLLPAVVLALSRRLEDWEIVVIKQAPNIDKHRLHRARDAFIRKLHDGAEPVLNPKPFAVARTTYHARVKAGMPAVLAATTPAATGSRALLAIYDKGVQLTIRQAAERLGCVVDTLSKRLQKIRKQRPETKAVDLAILAEGSKRARSFWK